MCRQQALFIILLFIVSPSLLKAQEKKNYGTYSHAPQGSTRAMAMGGAYAGVSDDADGIIYNPAGLAHGKWFFDFGSTTNTTVNEEADIDQDEDPDGIPYQFQFVAGAIRLGPVALAVGTSSPYSSEIRSPYSTADIAKLNITSSDFLVAIRLSEELAVGAALRQETLYQSYETWSISRIENRVEGRSYTAGVSIRPSKAMGFGISYNPPRTFEVDTDLNIPIVWDPSAKDYGWFRGASLPERLTFGGFFKASERLMYVADLDILRPNNNNVYVKSPFVGSIYQDQGLKTHLVQIPHGGIEYYVVKEKRKEFIWRIGGYREPARVAGGSDRLHFTMGVEVRLGPIVVSAAMDETSGFTNSTQSLGFSLGDL